VPALTPLLALGYVLGAAATGLAWALRHRDRQHLPAAVLLTAGLGSDLARRALAALVLTPAHAALGAAPLPPSLLWAVALTVGLQLAHPAALAGAALACWSHPRAWLAIAGAWLACSASIALAYPAVRGDALGTVYGAASGLAVTVSVAAFLVWARKRNGMTSAGRVVLFATGAEVVAVISAWPRAFSRWDLAQVIYSALYAVCIFVQAKALWIPSPSRSSSSSS
jgi:hypothetical protein